MIQKSEFTYVSKSESLADRFKFGQRQLFISTIRNYLEIPIKSKKKNLLTKPRSGKTDARILYEFITLAYRLGFFYTSPNPGIDNGALEAFI